MNVLVSILVLVFSIPLMAEQPAGALLEWKGRNPIDGTNCRLQVFDISLSPDEQVQFWSQLQFENPFFISPRIWIKKIGEESDFYSGSSIDEKVKIELYTKIPEATLPEIETIKMTIMMDDSVRSLKCSTYEEPSK